MEMKCIGDIHEILLVDTSPQIISIENVQYIPDLVINLLSVNKSDALGHEVVFNNRGCNEGVTS